MIKNNTVFSEIEFWLLVFFSVIIPFGIYWLLLLKKTISQIAVFLFGFTLVVIAAIDVYLLQSLKSLANLSPSLIDDGIFTSELSIALYLLPAMFGGIGINLLSHVLINHLLKAEKRFKQEHPDH